MVFETPQRPLSHCAKSQLLALKKPPEHGQLFKCAGSLMSFSHKTLAGLHRAFGTEQNRHCWPLQYSGSLHPSVDRFLRDSLLGRPHPRMVFVMARRRLPSAQPILHRDQGLALQRTDCRVHGRSPAAQIRAVESVRDDDRLRLGALDVEPVGRDGGLAPRVACALSGCALVGTEMA